jgi:prepilin-type N-terminal cleavage/methylation domain-containing protein
VVAVVTLMKAGTVTRTTRRRSAQQGFTMLEVLIAVTILAVVCSGLLGVYSMVVALNGSQGEIATRATQYCQDKMEQLMALNFTDSGLGGSMAASSTVGSTTTATTGYVDYFDADGNSPPVTGTFYTRMWSVSTDSTAKMKTITVVTTAATAAGGGGRAPSITLVCMKTSMN